MKIATFYSFKGGVGRSMGAMNLAWALTEKTRKVVLIDADLHAPGLTISGHFDREEKKKTDGIYGYLKAYLKGEQPHLMDYAHFVFEGDDDSTLHFVPVADLQSKYDPADLPWKKLETPEDIRAFTEYFRKDLIQGFDDPDYVLIDARTGFTEISGLFTVKVPDIVVLFSGLNEQNLRGTSWVLEHLVDSNEKKLVVVFSPVPEGEETVKSEQLEKAEKLLAKVNAGKKTMGFETIPYHPRAALKEEIFVRDWKNSQIAKAYGELKSRLTHLNDNDIETIIDTATILLKQGKENLALDVILKGCKRFIAFKPFSQLASRTALLSSWQPFRAGNTQESLSLVNLAIEYDPNNADAYAIKGDFYQELSRFQEAIDNYDQALRLNPRFDGVFNNKGTTLHKMSRFEEALACFEQAIMINPENYLSYNNKGLLQTEMGQLKEAIGSLDQAIRIKPDFAQAFSNKANALLHLKRFNEALDMYNQAIRLNDNNAKSFLNKGVALENLNRYNEAIDTYNKALEIEPKYAMAHFNKGALLFKDDRFEDALFEFVKAIELQPDYAKAYFNQGIVLSKMGRLGEAVQCFEKTIILKPDFAEAYTNLAVSLMKLNKFDEALSNHHKALSFEPNNSQFNYNLGCFLALQGQNAEALKILEKAISLDEKARAMATNDDDFKSLWDDPRFIELTGRGKKDSGKKSSKK